MHEQQDGKLDLVPMIDCIMLLLLFFILTTRFSSDEKVLAALLPPKGQIPNTPVKPVPKEFLIKIAAYPEGMDPGLQPSQYQERLDRLIAKHGPNLPVALVRVGGGDPIRIDGAMLNQKNSPELSHQIEAIHRAIGDELRTRETTGAARQDQPPINIRCFSGLSWKFALVVYDAVRAYESKWMPPGAKLTPELLADARPVEFAPPLIRNISPKERGEELYEIVNMR
jgi:hypothetical protein